MGYQDRGFPGHLVINSPVGLVGPSIKFIGVSCRYDLFYLTGDVQLYRGSHLLKLTLLVLTLEG